MKILHKIKNYFDLQSERDKYINSELNKLKAGIKILDAGCGNQRYRNSCKRFEYYTQDLAEFKKDKAIGFADGAGGKNGYEFGEIDYVGNIWEIQAESEKFDAILCSEVLEHIPYPNETKKEFSRLLRPGGKLIITAPSNCLRHMDPYYYYSGFSDHWFSEILRENNFAIYNIIPVGDYYRWLAIELGRAGWHHNIFSKILLLPAFLYSLLKKPNNKSINTLCLGYHVLAEKK